MSEESTFHRYRLVRRIARGGMAEVYLAVLRGPSGFEKRVALKKILPVYAGLEEFAQLFKDEARLTAALDHSAVVQVHDFGVYEGEFYIAMEYIDGPDLEELLDRCRRRGILPPIEVVVHVGHQLAQALEYAHARRDPDGNPLGIIHRDVSPPNVLVGVLGEVKLTDFGVAKATVREAMTRPGVLRGKYAYMSPEQVRHRSLDHRSDIFSLGIVLYEALTGVNPFEGSTDFQTMESVERAEVEPAGFLRPDTPAELDRILLACLEPDPDLRYQDATDLRRDLAAVQRGMHAPDGLDSMQAFLRDVFPDRAPDANEAESESDETPVLSWETLAHRLPAMLVSVPRKLERRPTSSPPATPPAASLLLTEVVPPAPQEPLPMPEPIDPEPESAPERMEPDSGWDSPPGPLFREVGPRARNAPAAIMEWMEESADPDRILTQPGADVPFLPKAGDNEPAARPAVQLGPASKRRQPAPPDEPGPGLAPLLSPADVLPPETIAEDLDHTEEGIPIFNEWETPNMPAGMRSDPAKTAPSAVRVRRQPIALRAPPPAEPYEPDEPDEPEMAALPSSALTPLETPWPNEVEEAPALEVPVDDRRSTDPSARRPRGFAGMGSSTLWALAAILVPISLLAGMSWLNGAQDRNARTAPTSATSPRTEPNRALRRVEPLPPTRPAGATDTTDEG